MFYGTYDGKLFRTHVLVPLYYPTPTEVNKSVVGSFCVHVTSHSDKQAVLHSCLHFTMDLHLKSQEDLWTTFGVPLPPR